MRWIILILIILAGCQVEETTDDDYAQVKDKCTLSLDFECMITKVSNNEIVLLIENKNGPIIKDLEVSIPDCNPARTDMLHLEEVEEFTFTGCSNEGKTENGLLLTDLKATYIENNTQEQVTKRGNIVAKLR